LGGVVEGRRAAPGVVDLFGVVRRAAGGGFFAGVVARERDGEDRRVVVAEGLRVDGEVDREGVVVRAGGRFTAGFVAFFGVTGGASGEGIG
jgi:hypothetical protein